jgi:hypothetical protein
VWAVVAAVAVTNGGRRSRQPLGTRPACQGSLVPPGPSIAMQAELHQLSVPAALLLLPQGNHGFDLMGPN